MEKTLNRIVESLNQELNELRKGRAYWQFMSVVRGVLRDLREGDRES